jgi:outer membrane protein
MMIRIKNRRFQPFSFFQGRSALMIFSINLLLVASLTVCSEPARNFTLEDCIKTALDQSPALKVGQEKIVESTAKVKEIRTSFLPKFSATASATKLDEAPYMDISQLSAAIGALLQTYVKPDALNPAATAPGGSGKMTLGSDKIYSVALSVQQPIFTGGKISNGYKAAENGLKAVKENEAKNRREVILEVKKIFFTILQTERLAEVTDTSIRQLTGIVHDLENMKEQGMVGDPEVMNANVQLYNTELLKIKADNGVILAKSTLCNSMGIDWNTPLVLKYDFIEPASVDVADLPALVEKARTTQSEVKALEYQREALKNIVAINKGNYLPTIVAVGNYNFKNPNREYKEEFYDSWDITLALKMNIFDWGEGTQKLMQAKSQLRQLDGGIIQLKNGLAVLVEKNFLAVEEAFKKIDLNKKAMEKAQSSYNITLDKFQVGMAKNSDLLDAQRTLTQAKIDFYNSIAGYYMAHAELEHLIDKNI